MRIDNKSIKINIRKRLTTESDGTYFITANLNIMEVWKFWCIDAVFKCSGPERSIYLPIKTTTKRQKEEERRRRKHWGLKVLQNANSTWEITNLRTKLSNQWMLIIQINWNIQKQLMTEIEEDGDEDEEDEDDEEEKGSVVESNTSNTNKCWKGKSTTQQNKLNSRVVLIQWLL